MSITTPPWLEAASERAARLAAEEFLGGALRSAVEGELVFETQNSRYRLVDGVCFDATGDGFVGAELVGWLFETNETVAVSAWWRRGARAVLILRNRSEEIVVTSPTVSLTVGGRPARDGFATQEARFVVARPDAPLDAFEQPLVMAREVRPSSPAPERATLRPPHSPPKPVRVPRPAPPLRLTLPRVPLPVSPDAVSALRARGVPVPPQVWLPPVTPPPRH